MGDRSGVTRYFPDRPPTWLEVIIGALVVSMILPDFLAPKQLSWPAVLLGFLAFALAIGPVARTSFGIRIGCWFRAIGVTGRLVVISVFAFLVAIAAASDVVPLAPLSDAATGGLVAVLLYLLVYIATVREVSGWVAD